MVTGDVPNAEGRRVIPIGAGATVEEASALLVERNIGSPPVVAVPGPSIGISTGRDVLLGHHLDLERSHQGLIEEVRTSNPITCRPTNTPAEAMGEMAGHRVGPWPVVDGGGPVGLVSVGDPVQAPNEQIEAENQHLMNDLHGRSREALRAKGSSRVVPRQEELTMDAVLGGGIVAGWGRDAFGMPTFRVHTTDYPEIEAEGRTPVEACDRLVQHLVRAVDFTSEAWKCRPLGLALVDARAFARASIGRAEADPEPSRHPLDLTSPGSSARCPDAGFIQEASPGSLMNLPNTIPGRTRPSARRRPQGLATADGDPRSERDRHRLARISVDRPELMTDRAAAQICHVSPTMIGLWVETGAWPLPDLVCASTTHFRAPDVECWLRTGTWPAGVTFRGVPDGAGGSGVPTGGHGDDRRVFARAPRSRMRCPTNPGRA